MDIIFKIIYTFLLSISQYLSTQLVNRSGLSVAAVLATGTT